MLNLICAFVGAAARQVKGKVMDNRLDEYIVVSNICLGTIIGSYYEGIIVPFSVGLASSWLFDNIIRTYIKVIKPKLKNKKQTRLQ